MLWKIVFKALKNNDFLLSLFYKNVSGKFTYDRVMQTINDWDRKYL